MSVDESGQAQVIAFLSDPATYGDRPVERISTHAAHIFLGGAFAYKLKRAVKLPFLDFSTAEKRHAMLAAELDLNRDTAPSLYIAVRPIYANADGSLRFDGGGKPVDWVLVMRRFAQDALLDNVAQRGGLTAAMIDALADVVAGMHQRAPVKKAAISAAFTRNALDNIAALQDAPVNQMDVGRTAASVRACLEELAGHLDARATAGYSRRCHGDLHLGNIVLLEDNPTPFDALEFDPALATGDVFYDLAFVLMDLDHRGLRPSTNRLLNRYVQVIDDIEGIRGLPLFLAVRALIRAKVAAIAASQTGATAPLSTARSYLNLAAGYLPPPQPGLIAIGGFSGTGKTALARSLAPHLGPAPGALVFRSDVSRKQLHAVGETTRLPREAYTKKSSEAVYGALLDRAERGLRSGASVIVDAVFAAAAEREAFEAVARRLKVPFLGLWLVAALQERIQRVAARTGDASDADAAVAEAQADFDTGEIRWQSCDASGSESDTLRRALASFPASFRMI